MRSLIDFLIKNSSWFVFLTLEVICFYFVFSANSYQKSVYLNSSNEIVGRVYSASTSITSYFGLKDENQLLLKQNAELQLQINNLRNAMYELQTDSLKIHTILDSYSSSKKKYNLLNARVVNNNISVGNNTITIDKGSNHGVEKEIGVISTEGIVGFVKAVGNNYSIIQSILNIDTKISCKVLSSNAFGFLSWDEVDARYAHLIDYPKFEKFEIGDSIITSGYSDMFPEGLFVGTIEDYHSQTNDNFYSLKIKLATNFSTLSNVLLINNTEELNERYLIEKQVKNAKK